MDDRTIGDGQKFASIGGPWIIGTVALTRTQALAINMFITCSTPPSRRNDTPGIHETLKVVWERANFAIIVHEESMRNKGRMLVTGM